MVIRRFVNSDRLAQNNMTLFVTLSHSISKLKRNLTKKYIPMCLVLLRARYDVDNIDAGAAIDGGTTVGVVW